MKVVETETLTRLLLYTGAKGIQPFQIVSISQFLSWGAEGSSKFKLFSKSKMLEFFFLMAPKSIFEPQLIIS